MDGPFGSNLKTEHYTEKKEVRIIQLNNIGELEWKNNGVKYTTFSHAETLKRCKSYPGDIVIAKMMPAGRAVIIPDINDIYVISSDCVRLQLPPYIDSNYIMYMINSTTINSSILETVQGIGRSRTSLSKLKEILVPLPGYIEQQKITEKIINLLIDVAVIDDNITDILDFVRMTKNKILDLAIRGKLVPQDPNDEPASVLLERIHEEKEELIKQGKIKRDKKESFIFRGDDNSYYENVEEKMIDISDELPFNIPDSWCWGKLKDIVIINPRNKLDDDMEVAFIPMPLIEDGYSGNHSFEIRKWKDIKSGFTHFKDGDVGIAKITPCFENRKSVVFKNLCNGYGAGTTELHVLRPYKDTILAEFLLVYAKSQRFIEDGKQTFSGAVGQQRIGKEYIETVYFPIPPLQEQQRIINHINNLFNYLNVIETALS